MKKVISILSVIALLCSMLAMIAVPVSAQATTLVNQFVLNTDNMYYVNANGTTGASNNFYSSDYIEVAAGETLYLGPCDASQGYQFVTFDADKANGVQIKAAKLTVVETLASGAVIYSYVVPEGVAYIRMTAAAVYARWFLLTRNQPFNGAGLLRYLAAAKPVTRNDYDPLEAQAGYYNADKTVMSHAAHFSAKELTVAKNDTVFFGPCNANQNFQLYYWKTDGTATKVQASNANLKLVDTFDNGQVIYAYRCPDAGSVGVVNASAYNDYFMISKNDPMVVQSYYDYRDDQENANLYYVELDKADACPRDDGSFESITSYSTSHAIRVEQGDQITFGPANPSQQWHMMAFDADMTPILPKVTASSLAVGENFYSGAVIYTYTAPVGVSYVKVVNANAYKYQFLITKNNAFDVDKYNVITGNDLLAEKDAVVEESVLNGKSALFIGDSICYGANDSVPGRGWAGRISHRYGLSGYTNNGVSGASLSTARWQASGTVSGKNHGRILFQLTQEAPYYYDYVILHGGANDAWESYPVGKVSDSFEVEDFDLNTYAGGLEELFYYATKYYPNANIGYLMNFKTPARTNGRVSDMSEYFAEAKKICEKWDMPYFDMYNHDEINEKLKFDTKAYTSDYIHPNAAGYDILYPYIAEWMETLTPYTTAAPVDNEKTVIACVGDSITKGERSGDVNRYSYPARLQEMLGEDYEVLNLGWGGATAQTDTSNPYQKTVQYRMAKESNADIVVIKLAHNDTKSDNWDATNPEAAKAKFKTALKELVVEMQNLPSNPTVYMVTPAWALGSSTDAIFADYMIPAINEIATELGCTVIDVNTVTQNKTELYSLNGTNVHPNKEGYGLIAETVYKSLMGKDYVAPAPVDTSVPETDTTKPLMVNYEKYPDATAYRLETVADVEKFGDLIASGVTFVGKTVYLMNDIDFSGLKFTPLGASSGVVASNEIDYNRAFQGTFDGQYHVFKNVEIESMWYDTALFPVLHRATIKNFGLDGGSVRGYDVVASIVGYGDYACVIENVWSSADVYAASKSDIQGSAGIASNLRRTGNGTTEAAGTSTLKNVAYYGELNATVLVGGVCAWGQSGGNALKADNIIFGGEIFLRGKPNYSNGSNDLIRYGAAVSGVTSNLVVAEPTPAFQANYDTTPTVVTAAALANGTTANNLNTAGVGLWTVKDGRTIPCGDEMKAPVTVTVNGKAKYTDYTGKLIDQKAFEGAEEWMMDGESYTAEELLAYTFTAPATVTAPTAPIEPSDILDFDANAPELQYLIKDVAGWKKLTELVNGGLDATGMTFILMNDLDFSGVSDVASIGSATATAFKGTLDGNGKTVRNLTMANAGLFRHVGNATFNNLKLERVTNTWSNRYGGIFVGELNENASVLIDNVDLVDCSYTCASNGQGMLVGRAENAALTIKNCDLKNSVMTYNNSGNAYNGGFMVGSANTSSNSVGHFLVVENSSIIGCSVTSKNKVLNVGLVCGLTEFVTLKNVILLNNTVGFSSVTNAALVTGYTETNGTAAYENVYIFNSGSWDYRGASGTHSVKGLYTDMYSAYPQTKVTDANEMAWRMNAISDRFAVSAGKIASDATYPTRKVTFGEAVRYTDVNGLVADVPAADQGFEWVFDATVPVKKDTDVEARAVDLFGDINGDHAFNAADVSALLQYCNGDAVAIHTEKADVNGDGRITLADALRLLKSLNA